MNLKQCPKCGGEPSIAYGVRRFRSVAFVYCCSCPAKTKESGERAAVRAWNKGEVGEAP